MIQLTKKKTASTNNIDNSYECSKCVYEATTHADLKEHDKDNHSHQEFKCEQCGHIVLSDSDLKGLMDAYHEEMTTDNEVFATIYLCDTCDQEYERKVDLEAHMLNSHTETQCNFKCDKCDYEGESLEQLTQHRQTKHFHFRYFCCACDYETLNRDILKAHKLEKHEGRVIQTRKEKLLPPPKCNLKDSTHNSACCDRKPGTKKPVIYSHDQRVSNGICTDWNKGYCEASDLCKYLHLEIEECKFSNFCSRSNCKYWHDIPGKFPFLEGGNLPRRTKW